MANRIRVEAARQWPIGGRIQKKTSDAIGRSQLINRPAIADIQSSASVVQLHAVTVMGRLFAVIQEYFIWRVLPTNSIAYDRRQR